MLIVVATSAALSSVFMINLSFGIGHMVGEWPTAGRGLQHLRVSLCPERPLDVTRHLHYGIGMLLAKLVGGLRVLRKVTMTIV